MTGTTSPRRHPKQTVVSVRGWRPNSQPNSQPQLQTGQRIGAYNGPERYGCRALIHGAKVAKVTPRPSKMSIVTLLRMNRIPILLLLLSPSTASDEYDAAGTHGAGQPDCGPHICVW